MATAYQRELQARMRAVYNKAHGIEPQPTPDPIAALVLYMNPPCEEDN